MNYRAEFRSVILFALTLILVPFSFGQTTPGAPGADAQWASAGKQAVGTSATPGSKIWFTLQGGALTDVYYPNVAVNNVHLLQFVVFDPKTKKIETERVHTDHEIKALRADSLTFPKDACVERWLELEKNDGADSAKISSPFKLEGTSALLLYEGEAKSVEIVGDFTDWKQKKFNFTNVPGTDKKCYSLALSPFARVEYRLVADGKWMLDPLNAKKIDNGVGSFNSVIEMPGYEPTKWDRDFDDALSSGLSKSSIVSKKFGTRDYSVYIPTDYFKRGIAPKLPVLYLQDGTEYIERAKAINILENLVTARKVEPFMIVFVDPVDRMKEYWANDDWADFMALELVPDIEKKYFSTLKTGRENRALLGASLGGVTSIWTALRHPDVFGRVGAQSASFWIDDERVVKKLETLDRSKHDFRFYLDDGFHEGVDDTRKVLKILKDKGFRTSSRFGYSGHNWTSWRDRLADAFLELWD